VEFRGKKKGTQPDGGNGNYAQSGRAFKRGVNFEKKDLTPPRKGRKEPVAEEAAPDRLRRKEDEPFPEGRGGESTPIADENKGEICQPHGPKGKSS